MPRDETPPFARGETYYNGETIDTNNLGGVNLEGKEYTFEVNAPDDPSASDPSGRPVIVRVVRNKSGIALKPKRLVQYRANADSPLGTAVDGYTTGTADIIAGMVDEFLPAAGVAANDLFYIVVQGPTVGTTVDSSLTTLAIGDIVVAGTGTSKTNNDAGKINKIAGSPPTTAAVLEIAGRAAVANAVVTTATAMLMRRPV